MPPDDTRTAPTLPRLESEWATSRHGDAGWPKYLQSVQLDGLRGWSGEVVEFRFPLVAIAGENGAGKSTVLKASAAAYTADDAGKHAGAQTFFPDDFFPNTPWETVSGVVLTYTLREGTSTRVDTLRKRTSRWRGMPERPKRSVFFLDISRTQPIDTLIGYGRLARAAIADGNEQIQLTSDNIKIMSRVMARSYDEGEFNRGDGGKQVGVLTVNGRTMSNFHQGAGEDATMDLIGLLQEVPRHSLVVIDEVESSLHPRAQRRLLTELIELTHRRKFQFILSTHSPYILEMLPPEARIYIDQDRNGKKEIIYGATSDYAMGRMDDRQHPELDIYCEDQQAACIIDSLIRAECPTASRRVKITPIGPASAVRAIGDMAANDRLPRPSIAVLDADQQASNGCIVLPGFGSPETVVFRALDETTWRIVAERLGVRPGDLLDAATDAMRDDQFHAWAQRIAERVSPMLRAARVWENAVDVWVRDVLASPIRAKFVADLLDRLPPIGQVGVGELGVSRSDIESAGNTEGQGTLIP